MTSTSRKPRRRASSTKSYCRRLLSRLVWTYVCVDCLTYTTAFRFKTVAGRTSALVIAVLLCRAARRLRQEIGQAHDDPRRSGP
jgi:hypothetical protein